MTEMATISAKIPKETKKKMDELGISPSEVFRKAVDRRRSRRGRWALGHPQASNEARPILMKTMPKERVGQGDTGEPRRKMTLLYRLLRHPEPLAWRKDMRPVIDALHDAPRSDTRLGNAVWKRVHLLNLMKLEDAG